MKITKEIISNYSDYLYEEEKASATREKYLRDVFFFFQFVNNDCKKTFS